MPRDRFKVVIRVLAPRGTDPRAVAAEIESLLEHQREDSALRIGVVKVRLETR